MKMKKLFPILLASAVLFTACGNETKPSGKEIISTSVDPDTIKTEVTPGIVGSTLRHIGDLTSLKTNEQVDNFNSAPITCTDGERIYLIRRFPEELSTPEEYNDFAFGENHKLYSEIEIFTSDDLSAPTDIIRLKSTENTGIVQWYTITCDGELFYLTGYARLDDGNCIKLCVFDSSGEMLTEKKLGFDPLHEHIIHEGKLYVHATNGYNNAEAALTVEDLDSGEVKIIADNAQYAFRGEDGIYYIKRTMSADYSYQYHLYRYDAESVESESLMILDDELMEYNFYHGAAYDTDKEALYLAQYDKISVIHEGLEFSVLTAAEVTTDIIQLCGDHLLLAIGFNQVSLYQPTDDFDSLADQQISIKICCTQEYELIFENAFGEVLDKMNATGVFVKSDIVYTARQDEYINTMSKKLLAGDGDFDIFFVSPDMHGLLDENYYEDLSGYTLINSSFEKALPGVRELCTIGSKLSLVPMFIQFSTIYSDRSDLLSEMTYRGFMDSAYSADEKYYFGDTDIHDMMMPWFDAVYSNYIAETITDETAERDLSILYDDMLALADDPDFAFGTDYSVTSTLYRNTILSSDYRAMPLPKLSEEYKNSADGFYIAVNPSSPNKDIAAAFIAYYLEMSLNGEREQSGAYFTTYENHADSVLTVLLADSVRATADRDWTLHISDTYARLAGGSLTAEEAAELSMRYLKMARDE